MGAGDTIAPDSIVGVPRCNGRGVGPVEAERNIASSKRDDHVRHARIVCQSPSGGRMRDGAEGWSGVCRLRPR